MLDVEGSHRLVIHGMRDELYLSVHAAQHFDATCTRRLELYIL
jgi:hypothetical protein